MRNTGSILMACAVDRMVRTVRLDPIDGERGPSIFTARHLHGRPEGARFYDFADPTARDRAMEELVGEFERDGYIVLP